MVWKKLVESNWITLLVFRAKQKVLVLGWWNFPSITLRHIAFGKKKRLALAATGRLPYLVDDRTSFTSQTVKAKS